VDVRRRCRPAADAFVAFVAQGRPVRKALGATAMAAAAGTASTAGLTPRKRRSSHLEVRAIGHSDPGAEAVAV